MKKPYRFSVYILIPLIALLASASQAQVTVTEAWVRATVANQSATGAFMRLTSKKDAKLISANSDSAGVVEVHEMRMDNDIMRMRPIEGLQLQAGKSLDLKAGGYHLMMMDLKKQLKAGFEVQISLVFQNAKGERETVYVHAPVALNKPK
jgi:copper(I)-binding protein